MKVKLLIDGQEGWARVNIYGKRWTVESVFSCFKGLFGEYVRAKVFRCMVREVKLKCGLLNSLMAMP